jgi:predicted MFS family arabinose efflux permease
MLRLNFRAHSNRSPLLSKALINMGLLDELVSGFLFIGLPLVREQLGLSYEQLGLLFTAGACSGMILDPILSLLSDRSSKRRWILAGFLGLVVGFALAGSVHNIVLLLAAFVLIFPADSTAVGLSEAALIDIAPNESVRTMTRWTLLSSIGDLLSPLAVTVILATGLGWSGLCWIAVGLWLACALITWSQHFPSPTHMLADSEDAPSESMLMSLRKALRDPLLLRWGALSILPTMLDEVFLTFAILYLRDVLHANGLVIGLTIGIQMIGTISGLVIVERLVGRIAPRRLLTCYALLTLIAVVGFLSIRSTLFAPFWLFLIGFGASGLYPIAKAEAYARQPGRSGIVRAIINLGAPFEVALPAITGLIAARFGLLASLGFLGLAPLLILILMPRRIHKPTRSPAA